MGPKKRSPECCGIPPSSAGNRTATVFGAGNSCHIDEDGNEQEPMVQFQSTALKPRSGPIWYQLCLDVRHIPIAIYKILLNGPYMLITLGMAIDGLIVTGCSTFMSKYLERQFGVAPSKATLFMGAVMVPMAGFGTMFSGLIIHHFRLSCVRTLQYCITLVLCSLLLSPMYFIYCDHDPLVGIERLYPVGDAPGNHYDATTDTFVYHLDARCNTHCHCSPTEYHPRSFVLAHRQAKAVCARLWHRRFLNGHNIEISMPPQGQYFGGPSYGAAVFVGLVALAKNCKVKKRWTATGEIGENGAVSAVGGVRLKVRAARQEGMKVICLPAANRDDFKRIPRAIRGKMRAIFVLHVSELLQMIV